MDGNILQVIKDAAIGLLKSHDPGVDVYAEEIMRTQAIAESGDGEETFWYFVEVVPTSFTTAGPGLTEAALTVTVDYYDPEESIRQYGEKAIALDKVFRPVFCFPYGGERRAVTVARVGTSISGGLLHLTFPLTFLVSDGDGEELPAMEGLTVNIKEGGS